jgi:uncharacterized protein YjbI with pentapeptide repeats
VTAYTDTTEFRGAEFVDIDMSGSVFREVDLSGARMHGVLLMGADIDGALEGLRVNGIEVAPLIEAELNRRYPERAKLRPTTVEGLREAVETAAAFWATTIAEVRARPAADLDRSVNGEWSFVETLRHLIFVTDAWFRNAVKGEAEPFHPLGLPASFMTMDGLDLAARPTLETVLAVRDARLAELREYAATVSPADLGHERPTSPDQPWPPPQSRTPLYCLHVILGEEWIHRQFALRDLAVIDEERTAHPDA